MKKEVNLNIKRRGILSRIFSRATLFSLLFLAQIVLVILFAVEFAHYYQVYYWLDVIFRLAALIVMLFKKSETPYKVTWLIIITLFSILGAAIYLLISLDSFPYRMRRRSKRQEYDISNLQAFNPQNIKDLDKVDSRYTGVANYISYSGAAPTFKNNPLTYYESGEASLHDFLNDLKKAKKFIFLELFIVKQGTFLQEILAVLREKAKEGVKVKFLYDGFNAMLSLPFSYPKRLAKVGIETRVFLPQKTPFFHRESYRSHRKSVIIDGRIAYVGGVNIGDEYVNRIRRFGYWKDAMLRVEGDSVTGYGMGSRFSFIHNELSISPADMNFGNGDANTHGDTISFEYIKTLNPNIIFVVDRSQAIGGEPSIGILDNVLVNSTDAAMNDRIVILDSIAWYIVSGGYQSTLTMINNVSVLYK